VMRDYDTGMYRYGEPGGAPKISVQYPVHLFQL
jgi:hypothetical protein